MHTPTCRLQPNTESPSENVLSAGVLHAIGRGCRNNGADEQAGAPLMLPHMPASLPAAPPSGRGAAGRAPRPVIGASGAPSSGANVWEKRPSRSESCGPYENRVRACTVNRSKDWVWSCGVEKNASWQRNVQ
eukprot:363049-Chlamydomonas_euryale.AAC.31